MTRAGQKIRAWREAKCPKLTQDAAAGELGVSKPQLVRWELGLSTCSDVRVLVRLERLGVCSLEDWTLPADPADSGQAAA